MLLSHHHQNETSFLSASKSSEPISSINPFNIHAMFQAKNADLEFFLIDKKQLPG
jgi:hypothetical protein